MVEQPGQPQGSYGYQAPPGYYASPPAPADADSLDLRWIWSTLMRHKWVIICFPLLVAMLTYLYVSTLTPIYQAQSTLIFEPDSGNVMGIQSIDPRPAMQGYLQTQVALLQSRSIASMVVEGLDLARLQPEQSPSGGIAEALRLDQLLDWRKWARLFGLGAVLPLDDPAATAAQQPPTQEMRTNQAIGRVMRATSIVSRPNTQLVDIRVQMADPRLAAAIANSVARSFINAQIEGRFQMAEQATGWMRARLTEIEQDLEESERRLQKYVASEDLINLDGVATVEAAEIQQLNNRLVQARQDFAQAQNQFEQISSVADADWREQLSAPVLRNNGLISGLISNESSVRAKVEQLAERYGPLHPSMIAARDELEAIQESLRRQIGEVIASIEQSYQLTRANLNSLQASFDENREAIREVQAKETEFKQLQREVESNRALYETFLNRLKETSITADIEDTDARIVQGASAPRSPIRPRVMNNAQLAGVLALFLVVGLAFLREYLNNAIRSPDEISEKLGMPVLGIVPLRKRVKERSKLSRLFFKDTDRSFSEAIRTIRTSVMLSELDEARKTILVTSTVPGEGKSSVASNLAAALGQMERVVLVEADMRKPSFRTIYPSETNGVGLADVLSGETLIEAAIKPIDGADVLECGSIPANPLELLSSRRFSEMLARLGASYDRVIIDSPPVQSVSDPLVLMTCADAVIYVVRSDSTPVALIRKGLARISDAPILGIVLEQLDIKKSRNYGYGYGDKYSAGGYYDYYGYSNYYQRE